MNDSPQELEGRIDRYARGELGSTDARWIAREALGNPDLFEELTAVALVRAALDTGLAKQKLSLDETVDRYLDGALDASEERRLAQAALDHPEVFDALVAHGAVESSLQHDVFRARVVQTPRKARILTIASIAAAALLAVFLLRSPVSQPLRSSSTKTAASGNSSAAPPAVPLKPSLDTLAGSGQPILLAAQLNRVRPAGTPVFRGAATATRLPESKGSIISLDQKIATVTLGSLDGLSEGSELRVFRDGASSQPIGRIVVSTVFRDQARGRIVSGETIQTHDEVRSDGAVYLRALFDQAQAMRERGDLDAARETARRSLAWKSSTASERGEQRKILDLLAVLDFQAGATDAALEHLQAAVQTADANPSALNRLAVLYLVRGDYDKAGASLIEGEAKAATDRLLLAQVRNNLGVLSELRGDSTGARAHYLAALQALNSAPGSSASDRRAIETNLARVKPSK